MKSVILILFSLPYCAICQQGWTLQQCIDTAMANNRSILISKLNQEKSDILFKNNTFNFFPNINAGATNGFNFGQTIDPFTNQFANQRVQTANLYLTSSATLFSGLQNYYNRKMLTIDRATEEIKRLIEERNQKIEVTTLYMQCLLNREIVDLAERNVSASEEELKRIKILIQESRKVALDEDRIQSQISRDQISLRNASRDLQFSLINLQQIMGRTVDSLFTLMLEIPTLSTPEHSAQLEKDLTQLTLQKQTFQIRQSKGQFFPRIALNGSLGSGYSENNVFANSSGQFIPKPLQTQLSENLYQTISASLTIPIYNNHKTISQIKIAELDKKQKEIETNEFEQLYLNKKKQIEIEVNQTKSDRKAYENATSFAEKEYKATELLHREGRISYYDYLNSRNLLLKAQSEEIQAKYKALLSDFILRML